MYDILISPEEMGLPSLCINNFLKKLQSHEIPMHSVLISRHGNLITKAYYAPYKEDTLHRMFSVTKSFTSIAIGKLVESGQLSLSDHITKYFPDMLPEQVHPFLNEMTIEDMLKMQTCFSQTTYKANPNSNWVESFFTTRPSHKPGRVFNYDTSASHTLCALVERLTGKALLDYLRESVLDQLGFSKQAYVIKDPFGTSMGGTGLMATSMDLLLFATLIFQEGNFKQKQLLSKEYIQNAIAHHSDTLIHGPTKEERCGYGYQFWRIQHNGYACYGMGGQLAICLPDYDLIVVTTADTQGIQGGNQYIYNALYEEILPYLSDTPLAPNNTDKKALDSHIETLSLAPLSGETRSEIIKDIQSNVYTLATNNSEFEKIYLEFNEEKENGKLIIQKHNSTYTIPFGLGHMVISSFPIYNQRCSSSAIWLRPDTLYIKSHIIDECIGSIHFHLTFKENTLSLYMKKIEETYFNEFSGYITGYSD